MYKIIIVLKDCYIDEITCDDFYLDFRDRYIATIKKHNSIRKFHFEFMKELFVIDYDSSHVHEIKL